MKVLITGAEGMLGKDLSRILVQNNYEVIETDKQILDIADLQMVEKVLTEQDPDVVIHCAAYTNVDGAETDFETAKLINVTGTENVAKICAKKNITIVYISTDYVFDGDNSRPYKPADTPNPINNYGLTKLGGEKAVQKYCTKYYICRTSWLYGIHGKNFVETMLASAGVKPVSACENKPSRAKHNNSAVATESTEKGAEQSLIAQADKASAGVKPEIKVVDDQIGCPTWTVDLSNAIVKILKEKPYGIYHTCGRGQTSWYGFAKTIFEICAMNVNLVPCTTEEFPRPAKRPKYSVMDNEGICSPWHEALADYLELYHL